MRSPWRRYQVSLPAKIEHGMVTGVYKSKLTALGVEPPSVALGVIASVEDYIELHFSWDLSKLQQKGGDGEVQEI